jgi:hypothetical protein
MINFKYDKSKDIWCILNKGRASNNSSNSTKIYELIVQKYGDDPTEENVNDFIGVYLNEMSATIADYTKQYELEWSGVAGEYHKRAQAIFNTTLPADITSYLTINNRCPYSIADNLFYVSFPRESVRKTVMHELWHFYTWYGLGANQEDHLGKQKYNDYKESLTVLLNEECLDLMPEGTLDEGYPQHQELREEIKLLWRQDNDIKWVWESITTNQQF